MTERLLHHSKRPLPATLDATVRFLSVAPKPRGLWLSVAGSDDWKSWCDSEQFAQDCFTHVTEIILKPRARILRVPTAFDIDLLTQEYSAPRYAGCLAGSALDWPRIARQHDGIIIAPYQWSRRLHDGAGWYYGWDCASGCIWRPRAIADVQLIAEDTRCAA